MKDCDEGGVKGGDEGLMIDFERVGGFCLLTDWWTDERTCDCRLWSRFRDLKYILKIVVLSGFEVFGLHLSWLLKNFLDVIYLIFVDILECLWSHFIFSREVEI